MRIISGIFKGKKLFLPTKNTRPLKDLVKESIFNLIQHSNKINISIEDSSVLDLFAGSGSFGIECLSREAKKVVFFENHPEAISILEKNIKFYENLEKYEIYKKDCFNFFNTSQILNSKFDIIFIDPPYKELRINEIIEKIFEKKILNKEGIIIIHRHKKDSIQITKKLNIFENRSYGISRIFFGN
jgi:16S rRNA (guanine966-N2)-methyltransferase